MTPATFNFLLERLQEINDILDTSDVEHSMWLVLEKQEIIKTLNSI